MSLITTKIEIGQTHSVKFLDKHLPISYSSLSSIVGRTSLKTGFLSTLDTNKWIKLTCEALVLVIYNMALSGKLIINYVDETHTYLWLVKRKKSNIRIEGNSQSSSDPLENEISRVLS